MITKTKFSLTGNQLKSIAMIAMTCDHVGLQLLPQFPILRIIGRLALPIFAYMIAEGCRHTRNRPRYLLTILGFAFICQAVYFFAMGSVYMCILVTFSLSIALIYLLDRAVTRKGILDHALAAIGLGMVCFLCEKLPGILPHTDFAVDYGFWGVMLPVFIYFGPTRLGALVLSAVGLVLLALDKGGFQWYALSALVLLALYSGARGKYRMKYLFYIYYPGHLAAIYAIDLLLKRLS